MRTTKQDVSRVSPKATPTDTGIHPGAQLIYPILERHAVLPDRRLRMGLLNIRSVGNKIENGLELFDDYHLNILSLTETCHKNSDSVAIKRFCGLGLNVIEQARVIPDQSRLDDINYVNHGGIAVLSKPGTRLSRIELKFKPNTFELLCCRVGGNHTLFTIAVIYRPGSHHVSEQFFTELSSLIEILAASNSPTWIVGDLNIHLERASDSDSRKLARLLEHLIYCS